MIKSAPAFSILGAGGRHSHVPTRLEARAGFRDETGDENGDPDGHDKKSKGKGKRRVKGEGKGSPYSDKLITLKN